MNNGQVPDMRCLEHQCVWNNWVFGTQAFTNYLGMQQVWEHQIKTGQRKTNVPNLIWRIRYRGNWNTEKLLNETKLKKVVQFKYVEVTQKYGCATEICEKNMLKSIFFELQKCFKDKFSCTINFLKNEIDKNIFCLQRGGAMPPSSCGPGIECIWPVISRLAQYKKWHFIRNTHGKIKLWWNLEKN